MDRKSAVFSAILLVFVNRIFSVSLNTISAKTVINISRTMRTPGANLTAITWAHAVNSQMELDDALAMAGHTSVGLKGMSDETGDIDMIEADIVLGKINNTGPDLPVMGHPPAVTSDISLSTFLRTILDFNDNTIDKKGVKLDFKSIEVFEGSLDLLRELWPLMTYPIWLNADIVKGPVNQTQSRPVDPDRFFDGCKDFDDAVLSIGWTTRWGADFKEGCYTEDEVDEMLDAIERNNVTETKQEITFPVRAGIAAHSEKTLHRLVNAVNDTNESSLTIWSSVNDEVDIKKLRNLIFSFGLDRIYLDVPEEVSSRLELEKGPGNSARIPRLVNISLIAVCVIAASFALRKLHS